MDTINADSVGLVGLHDKSVNVGELIGFALNFLVHEFVFALVVKDDVGAVSVSTDIGTKHDVVGAVAIEVALVEASRDELDVSATLKEQL